MGRNNLGDRGAFLRWALIPSLGYFVLSIILFRLRLEAFWGLLSWPAFWALRIVALVLYRGNLGAGFSAEGLLIFFGAGFYFVVGALASLLPTTGMRAAGFFGFLAVVSVLGYGLQAHDRKVEQAQNAAYAKERARLESIPAERAKLAKAQLDYARGYADECLRTLAYYREHKIQEVHGLPTACQSNVLLQSAAKEALRLASPQPTGSVWCESNLFLAVDSVLNGEASQATDYQAKWSQCHPSNDRDRQLVAVYEHYLPAAQKAENFREARMRPWPGKPAGGNSP